MGEGDVDKAKQISRNQAVLWGSMLPRYQTTTTGL